MNVRNRRARTAAVAMVAFCLASAPAIAQDNSQDASQDTRSPIGTAIQIVRQVTGEIQAQFRYLLRRDPVYRNEVIETQPDSASRIIFEDRTELSVGPNARITLDEFVFDPSPSIGKFFLSAFKGVFRFKTGRLAKTAYAIETPNAVIGVRGTTFATVFGPNGLAAIVLEAGDAVIVDIAASCPKVDAERIINIRDFAVVVDGCEISEPGPPPAWALEQIALLNGLLFELDRELGNIDPGPNNDSITPTSPATIPAGEITIQPASGPPTPLTPTTTVSGRVGFTHNDEDKDSRNSSSAGGNASANSSSNSRSHSSSSASSTGSSSASANSSGGKSSISASSNSSSHASSSNSGGKSSSNASSHSSSNASAGSSSSHSSNRSSSSSSTHASSSSSSSKSSTSASSRSSSSASSSSRGMSHGGGRGRGGKSHRR